MNFVNPKKLLLTKWTACRPENREKHFVVTGLVEPVAPDTSVQWIEIEAVHSGVVRQIEWRALRDEKCWRQGWV